MQEGILKAIIFVRLNKRCVNNKPSSTMNDKMNCCFSHITLRRLHMWPAAFQALIEAQFNVNGFNLPYHDARALECTYTEQNNRCVDNYRLR